MKKILLFIFKAFLIYCLAVGGIVYFHSKMIGEPKSIFESIGTGFGMGFKNVKKIKVIETKKELEQVLDTLSIDNLKKAEKDFKKGFNDKK